MSRRLRRSDDQGIWRRVFVESKGYRLRTLALLAVEFAATPLFLLSPIPLAIVVDSVLGSGELPAWVDRVLPDGMSDTEVLVVAAALQVLVVLLTDVQAVGATVLRTHTTEHLTLRLRHRLFSHVQRLSFAFHDRRGTSDSLYRIQYDSTSLATILVDNLVPLLSAVVTLVSVFLVFAGVDMFLAYVALAVTPMLVLLANVSKRRLRRHYKESKRLESDAMGVVHEVLGSFRVVKAFGREEDEQQRFFGKSELSAQKKVGIAVREGVLGLLINLTTAVGTGLILFFGAQRVQAGTITLGELLIAINYLARLYSPLKTIARRVTGLQRAYESLHRSFELLDEVPDVQERPNAVPIVRARGEIELRHVAFSYDHDQPVLENVSLHIPAGARVGIAGETGAGKTTLVGLLLRFYDPDAGEVRLDGLDVRDYRLADLRAQFSMVLQEPVLFSGSIKDNIAYGRPDAPWWDIQSAAARAGAHDFIRRLPDGYETRVGERGNRLSGGERQRISLARAFLKDAPILLLDEPTSSVDVETEATIMAALESLMRGRTTLMIAHRLSTLDHCDMIVRFGRGSSLVSEQPVPQNRETRSRQDPGSRARVPSRRRSVPEGSRHLVEAGRLWVELGNEPPTDAVPLRSKSRRPAVVRLLGARPGGKPVIAKLARSAQAGRESHMYAAVVPKGLSIEHLGTAPSSVEDGHTWLFLEDAGDRPVSLRGAHDRILAADWLSQLHGTSESLDLPAGAEEPSLRERWAALPDEIGPTGDGGGPTPAWARVQVSELWSRLDRLRDLLLPAIDSAMTAPPALTHGRVKQGHLRVLSAEGHQRIVGLDWATVSMSNPACDIARLLPPRDVSSVDHDEDLLVARRYADGIRRSWPDVDEAVVADCALVGCWLNLLNAVDWLGSATAWKPNRMAPTIDVCATTLGRLEQRFAGREA